MWKIKIFPSTGTARLGHLKEIKSFKVQFCVKSIVLIFLCRFRHQNKLFFNFLILGKSRFPLKSFTTLTTGATVEKLFLAKIMPQNRTVENIVPVAKLKNISVEINVFRNLFKKRQFALN